MRIGIIALVTVCSFNIAAVKSATGTSQNDLSCVESKSVAIGYLFYYLSKPQSNTEAHFYLADRNSSDEGIELNSSNSWVLRNKFDPRAKTYFIVHGYMADHRKRWVKQLTETILQRRKVNIILVDWSRGSKLKNYINAVQTTQEVTKRIINFLKNLRNELDQIHGSSDVQWNHLYFIGHSLGAHISGQTGFLLRKENNFFQVERITGLDPAEPCFTQVHPSFRLDKDDANFVDIIHTQTGNGGKLTGLGIKQSVGHIDFYINGGVIQPECIDSSMWNNEINRMICSHRLSYTYFIESLINGESPNCKFTGYKWDGTYEDALRIVEQREKGNSCSTCPEMGIDADKYNETGTYLVITSDRRPHCKATIEGELIYTQV